MHGMAMVFSGAVVQHMERRCQPLAPDLSRTGRDNQGQGGRGAGGGGGAGSGTWKRISQTCATDFPDLILYPKQNLHI